MTRLPYLRSMHDNKRDELLEELWRLVKRKKAVERWTEGERQDATKFRKYKTAFWNAERLLSPTTEMVKEATMPRTKIGFFPPSS